MIFKPHNYQRYCIEKAITQKEIGLFLDMGLGKTSITLTAINELIYNRFEVSKVLVIAPKKVAELTWNTESEKWDHTKHLRIASVLGSEQKRLRALNSNADIYVINRENVSWLVNHYKNQWPFDMVVIDELSSFKNHQAKRFKDLKCVRPHIKRIIGLTGTPSPNGLLDLWAQVYLLDQGERLHKRIGQYREQYFNRFQVDSSGWEKYIEKQDSNAVISEKLKDLCVSMSAEDYLDLPDLIVDPVWVQLDSKTKKQYKEMEQNLILQLPDGDISVTSSAALSNKLLQLCNGAIYDDDRDVKEIHDCKINALLETIENLNGQPALLFYSFQHDKKRILNVLPKSLRVRDLKTIKDQQDWNNGEIDILLAHPASAGYGLNLQDGGNHMIWFGLNWSLELYQQAIKRLHRQGQRQKVIVHQLLVKGGRDEDVSKVLDVKGDVQQALLDSLKARIEEVKNDKRRA